MNDWVMFKSQLALIIWSMINRVKRTSYEWVEASLETQFLQQSVNYPLPPQPSEPALLLLV